MATGVHDDRLLPETRGQMERLIQDKCRICGGEAALFDNALVLRKYQVSYFRCEACGFVQTETPYWLEEAYTSAIASIDVGILFRNLLNRRITAALLNVIFPDAKAILDYGAGHGIFVRLMRDKGYNFFWYDLHATNDYARGFEHKSGTAYDLVTSFEVLEHVVDPISEIERIISLSPNVFFSTELLPSPPPKVADWWYYAPLGGQHVALYTAQSLGILAKRYGLHLLSHGPYHLLSRKLHNRVLFRLAMSQTASHLLGFTRKRRTLLEHDGKFVNQI